ncbi:hypothetical protein [Noviherbaspirillum humi]|uniref:hypothetical protein n=1 Tax=Noviherbaspirillum humi TaxID=1688639 RepID=UPI0015960C83|nr:hypothetical protein [Noviherbaspirillum humi]
MISFTKLCSSNFRNMKNIKQELLINRFVAGLACMLTAACGGGGSSTESSTASAVSVAATSSFVDCVQLTPGVSYRNNDGYKYLIVQEKFNGQDTFGRLEYRPNGTRFGTFYQTIGDGYLKWIGATGYTYSTDEHQRLF